MKRQPTVWAFSLALAALLMASRIVPGQSADETLHHNNVMIVLDSSGSMDERMAGNMRKIDAAKKALIEVLNQVPPDTHIGLLVFSARNLQTDYVYPLGPRDDARLRQAILQPQPGGNTPLGAYIKKGADYLLERRAKQRGYGTYRLLIVTDGESTDQLVDPYLPDVLARGIIVDVIGVNMKADHTLATKVHSYRRADDPASLRRAVAEVFAEVSDKDTGIADESVLADIAALPEEMATAMLQALSNSSTANQPIGTKTPAAVEPKAPAGVQPPASKAPTRPKSAAPSRSRKSGDTADTLKTAFTVILIAVIIIMLAALRAAKAGSGGSHPRGRRRRP
ncbi:MAG: VWA domain-containing protein [Candidatus Sumerlaeia bacterium]|nr:VWA domain-containing protein [Candidatus Sumerlaeia bacterium]